MRRAIGIGVLVTSACITPYGVNEDESWDYSVSVAAFSVPAGAEVQRCYYMKFPSAEDVDISALRLENSAGSHHYQVYVNDENLPDGSEECFRIVDFNRWRMIFASQTNTMTWPLPEGVAIRLKANQQIMIQTHYINAGRLVTPSGVGGGTLRMRRADPAKVTTHLGAVFAVNHDIHLPARATGEATAQCLFDSDKKLAALTGHFHFAGESFEARVMSPATDGKPHDMIYRVDGFNDARFDTWAAGQAPAIPKGGGIEWWCKYKNTSASELTFGARELDHEHCNMFMFYYPAAPQEFRVCSKPDSDGNDIEDNGVAPAPAP